MTLNPLTRSRRVGITGSSHSGKTVFLLSLISHLEDGTISIPNGSRPISIERFNRIPYPAGGEKEEFRYEEMRRHLAAKKWWPQKTVDSSFFRCNFRRSGNNYKHDQIEFFDFPGERVADIAIIGKNYAEWSREMIEFLQADPLKKQHSVAFLGAAIGETSDGTDLLHTYKLALASLILDHHPLISPSTFLVDLKGNAAMGESPQEVVDDSARKQPDHAHPRYSGLPGKEFVPLPTHWKQSRPDLFSEFESNFNEYKKLVVNPFAVHLLSCDNLLFLIDVTDVLGSGPQKLNDTQEMIKQLLQCIDRGSNFFKRMVKLGLKPKLGGIKNIAFVASKADKVHASDFDQLKPLIRRVTRAIVNNSNIRMVDHFTCSAVESARSIPGKDSLLCGRPLCEWVSGERVWHPADVSEREVKVSHLPEEWPDHWNKDEYKFSDFFPIIPSVHRNLPRQQGLENIISFLLEH